MKSSSKRVKRLDSRDSQSKGLNSRVGFHEYLDLYQRRVMVPRASMVNLSLYYIRSLVLVNSDQRGGYDFCINTKEFDIIYSFTQAGTNILLKSNMNSVLSS